MVNDSKPDGFENGFGLRDTLLVLEGTVVDDEVNSM